MENIWTILGIITLILLIVYWGRRNAVWGGFTIGLVIGFIVALVFVFRGSGFDWYVIGKSAISGTIMGFGAELLGKIPDLIKRK